MQYIIIVGCSRTGRVLAKELAGDHNVVVIDKNLPNLDSLSEDFNGEKIWADALDVSTLEKAGIKEADAFFLLTGNDNLNLVVGKVAKRKYNVEKVILQVNDPVKKKMFGEEGLAIVNKTDILSEVLKKCIL